MTHVGGWEGSLFEPAAISGAAAAAVTVLSPVLWAAKTARGPNLLGPQTRGATNRQGCKKQRF